MFWLKNKKVTLMLRTLNLGPGYYHKGEQSRLNKPRHPQGSKIALVRSHLRVSQAAGQVKILIFLVKFIYLFPSMPIICA